MSQIWATQNRLPIQDNFNKFGNTFNNNNLQSNYKEKIFTNSLRNVNNNSNNGNYIKNFENQKNLSSQIEKTSPWSQQTTFNDQNFKSQDNNYQYNRGPFSNSTNNSTFQNSYVSAKSIWNTSSNNIDNKTPNVNQNISSNTNVYSIFNSQGNMLSKNQNFMMNNKSNAFTTRILIL